VNWRLAVLVNSVMCTNGIDTALRTNRQQRGVPARADRTVNSPRSDTGCYRKFNRKETSGELVARRVEFVERWVWNWGRGTHGRARPTGVRRL
jgi:hypothetical protein